MLREDEKHARYVADVVGTDRFSVSVFGGDIPYDLGVLDDTVQIGVEGSDGIPRALVETDSAPVREWADESISRYAEDSRAVTIA